MEFLCLFKVNSLHSDSCMINNGTFKHDICSVIHAWLTTVLLNMISVQCRRYRSFSKLQGFIRTISSIVSMAELQKSLLKRCATKNLWMPPYNNIVRSHETMSLMLYFHTLTLLHCIHFRSSTGFWYGNITSSTNCTAFCAVYCSFCT